MSRQLPRHIAAVPVKWRRPSQAGQAMIELLVAAMFFLVPFFVAITVIGKFADVQHAVDMAARYAVWERTIWYNNDSTEFNKKNSPNTKSSAEINNETAVRILNDRTKATSIIGASDKSASTFSNGLDPLWRDPAGGHYLTEYSQHAASVTMGASTSTAAPVAVGVFSLVSPSAIPSNTLAAVKVSLSSVARDSGPYQRLWGAADWKGLDFAATGAVLSNTWAANSSIGTKRMVIDLVPSANVGLAGTLGGVKGVIGLWDRPLDAGIEVGKIAVDEVPVDRLR